MQVNFVHILAPGHIAGLEKVVLSGLSALKEKGEAPKCVIIQDQRCPQFGEKFVDELQGLSIETSILKCYRRIDLRMFLSLRRLYQRRKWDIVHAHGYKAVIACYLAFLGTSVRIIATNHGDTGVSLNVRFFEWIQRKLFSSLDRVIAVSEKQKLEMHSTLPPSNISVIENMLTINIPAGFANHTEPGALKLVAVGRLSVEKGLDDLISAISTLKKGAVELTIVGQGDLRVPLERLALKKGVSKYIKFVGFQKDIRPYIKESHALVAPSHREGLPLNLIEAACYGKPIIASQVGMNQSFVKENGNGILVPKKNPDALASAISQMSLNRTTFASSASTMAPSFIRRFSKEKWASRTMDIYREILNA